MRECSAQRNLTVCHQCIICLCKSYFFIMDQRLFWAIGFTSSFFKCGCFDLWQSCDITAFASWCKLLLFDRECFACFSQPVLERCSPTCCEYAFDTSYVRARLSSWRQHCLWMSSALYLYRLNFVDSVICRCITHARIRSASEHFIVDAFALFWQIFCSVEFNSTSKWH